MRIGMVRPWLAAVFVTGGGCLFLSDLIAIPNPASVGCITLGGKGEMYRGPRGDAGFCRFGDALIDEWSLHRVMFTDLDVVASRDVVRERAGTLRATAEFLREKRPASLKDATTYCENVGGRVKTYVYYPFRRDSRKMVACHFDDGTTIEVNTLFRGPLSPGNASLKKVLLGNSAHGPKK